jgi:hypothetical protein
MLKPNKKANLEKENSLRLNNISGMSPEVYFINTSNPI